jgi:SRSO17 transposase
MLSYFWVSKMELTKTEIELEFEELMIRLSNIFPSISGWHNAKRYISGLLSNAERKNSWQMAESLGDATPYALQQFIYRGRY